MLLRKIFVCKGKEVKKAGQNCITISFRVLLLIQHFQSRPNQVKDIERGRAYGTCEGEENAQTFDG
jgi:hypothetical protein